MPSATGTKIFVGNLPKQVVSQDLRKLFEEYGRVRECDVLKNYGFVHMDSSENSERAIEALNGYELFGKLIAVEASTSVERGRQAAFSSGKGATAGIRRGGTKIFVGNLSIQATPDFIRKQFEEFGTVMECDLLKNYGFVHMDTPENAQKAISALNGREIFEKKMNVEASTSEVRRNPGMGGANRCLRCGSGGHWSRDCPDGPRRDNRRYDPGPGPLRPSMGRFYSRRSPYPRDRYYPYDRYDLYEDRYPPPPPPPRRLLSPDYPPEVVYARRLPIVGEYLMPRRYTPERRIPASSDNRDVYGDASFMLNDYPPSPPRSYSLPYEPRGQQPLHREYSPAELRHYQAPSPHYKAPSPARNFNPAIASRSPPREFPRAYGGLGVRLSPSQLATRRY